MAVLAKKLRIKASGGAQQAANIYSTAGEANNNAMRVSVDGVAGYVALGSTGDARRTNGRVKKSNGTTYAILANGTPDYGYRVLTANGSFTVPTGVTKLRVTCVGGGAGGFISVFAYCNAAHNCCQETTTYNGTHYGFAGGTTTFGSVSAAGGSQAWFRFESRTSSSESGSHTSYYTHSWNNSKGYHTPDFYCSQSNSISGGAAVPLTLYNGTQVATAGAGGYADGNPNAVFPGASGYRTVQNINVSPGQVIGYAIGGGGAMSDHGNARWDSWNSGGHGGAPGSAGAILVEWGKGIQ